MKSNSLLNLFTSTLVLFLISSFAAGQSFQRSIYQGPLAPDVVAADVNQDGKPDLLTPEFDEEGFGLIFLNRGDGTFPDRGSEVISPNGTPATRVVAADFNGDGITDIAYESCDSGGLAMRILSGDASHNFHLTANANRDFPPFASSCTDAIGLITFPGESSPAIVASSLDTEITIFHVSAAGQFTQQDMIPGFPGMILAGASVGDFNGDHLQDIAAVSRDPNGGQQHVVIFLQNPDGTFQPPVIVFSLDATLQFTQAVDFNGNESDDLLVPFFGGPGNRAGVIALTNVGPGKFRSTVLLADPFYIFAGQKAAAIHSAEKNGIRGILAPFFPAPSMGDSVFAFFPAQGDTWGRPIYFDVPNGKETQAVVTADFNGDGRPDFAGVDDNNELVVFLNTTNADTCGFPSHAGVRICSPDSDNDSDDTSRTTKIHASASGGALPIVAMKAYIDGKPVAESSINTLDASVPTGPGRHLLAVNAWDPNDKVYQSRVVFTVR